MLTYLANVFKVRGKEFGQILKQDMHILFMYSTAYKLYAKFPNNASKILLPGLEMSIALTHQTKIPENIPTSALPPWEESAIHINWRSQGISVITREK